MTLSKVVALLMTSVILAGCMAILIGDEDTPEIVVEEPAPQWAYFNETFVFENVMQTGHATSHNYNITVNSTMTIVWDITCRFAEPLVGDAGYVNITLESSGVALVSEEYTSLSTASFQLTDNYSNITGDNFNLMIQSVGSDHRFNGGMQDYYIVETSIEYL